MLSPILVLTSVKRVWLGQCVTHMGHRWRIMGICNVNGKYEAHCTLA